MPTFKPFQSYDEHDVINLFKWGGDVPVNKGTFVKIAGSGWRTSESNVAQLGSVGAAYQNVVSQRWGVIPSVESAGTGERTIGCLLYDVKEYDENGEKLIFNPRKQAEMEVALSGQAVPILTRGVLLYSGILGSPVAGAAAYVSGGQLTSHSTNAVEGSTVGTFLGAKDAQGVALVHINLK